MKRESDGQVSIVARLLALPLRALVWLYRRGISPIIGAHCRYQPSCSAYAEEALSRFGFFRGGWLTVKRLSSCHPWGGSGYDPVPGPDSHDGK